MNPRFSSAVVGSVVIIFMIVAASEGNDSLCRVEKRPLREVRLQSKRTHNEVLTKEFRNCRLRAYDNKR